MFSSTTWHLKGLFLKLARSAAATEQFSTAALEIQIFIAEKMMFNSRNAMHCLQM